ncbi:helix-turn-helix domain-containing protein [Paenibacillus sp. HGF5]|uniref:helix-turn-helix domain-containing protein n=1 Tax=Paenibacillus sp. HGF5 TaxID=908341 RepID=UPI00068168D7|nr:helix-turn-helix transcriptional regulator [Paenibacillus sp. HGF5]
MEFYVIDGNKGKNQVGVSAREIEMARELPHDPQLLERYLAAKREMFVAENEAEWAGVGDKLRMARIERGISLAGASRKIGFSASTLSRFEKGNPVLNATVIERSYEMMLLIGDLEAELSGAYQFIDELIGGGKNGDETDDEEIDNEIPEEILKLASFVMECEHEVVDFDYRRIYVDTSSEEYVIRTWNITPSGLVDWTLYKMISNDDGTGHGEEIRSGSTNLKQFSN